MRATFFDNITGVLLAGGKSRRMGGEDKGLLPLVGMPLAARTLARLSPQTAAAFIIANRNIADYEKLAPVLQDEIGGFCGPLAGIHAGMCAAKTEWILSAPCDTPFLPLHLAHDLTIAAKDSQSDIAVAKTAGREQPTFMLARTKLADDLAEFLNAGGRKIDLWYSRRKYGVANFADESAFANINTPEELAAAAAKVNNVHNA